MNSQSALAILLSAITWIKLYNNDLNIMPRNLLMNNFDNNIKLSDDNNFCDYIRTIIIDSCLNETNLIESQKCNVSWIPDQPLVYSIHYKYYYYDYNINLVENFDSILPGDYFIFQFIYNIFFNIIIGFSTSTFVITYYKLKSSKFSLAKIFFTLDIVFNLLFTIIYYSLNKL
jgi:hypothetical protein